MTLLLSIMATLAAAAAVFLVVQAVWPHRFLAETQQEHDADNVIAASRNVVLRRMGVFNARFLKRQHYRKFDKAYVSAGKPGSLAAPEFVALMELSSVGFGLFGYFLLESVGVPVLLASTFIVFGAVFPIIWLRDLIRKRHFGITRALPYSLDLLTLAVEAGLDFAGAVGKVVEKGKPGPLQDELAITLNEMRMGKTREEALRNLSDRVNLPALTTFVTNLIQADRMGTPLGKVLRIQSTQMRVERTQRAEKLANEAPVKMLFPLIACIFPTVFLVLFGPILFSFMFGRL